MFKPVLRNAAWVDKLSFSEIGYVAMMSAKMDGRLDGPGSEDRSGDNKLADTAREDADHGEDVEVEGTVEDQPEGLRKTVTKGLKRVKQLLMGSPAFDKEKGDHTETTVPHQPASAVSENDFDFYDFSHCKRGRAIIINNEKFHPLSMYGNRPGSTSDAKSLNEVFVKLGFDVVYHQNCTASEMKMVLEKEAKEYDHKNADCLAVAILSHGHREYLKLKGNGRGSLSKLQKDIILGVDGNYIFTDSIMRTFQDSRCPGLIGKPRLFFLQACRGPEYDEGRDILVYYDGRDQTDASAGTQPEELDHNSANNPTSPDAAVDTSITEPPKTVCDDTSTNAAVDLSSVDKQGLTGTTGKAPVVLGHGVTDVTYAVGSIADDDSDDDETDASGQRPVTERLVLSPAPIFKDYLVMYATTPGHFAWRRTTGSWFVQSLHSIFMKEYSPNMTLTQALTSVIRMVALGYESQGSDPQYLGKKQTPVIQHMLVKDVYFSPKK